MMARAYVGRRELLFPGLINLCNVLWFVRLALCDCFLRAKYKQHIPPLSSLPHITTSRPSNNQHYRTTFAPTHLFQPWAFVSAETLCRLLRRHHWLKIPYHPICVRPRYRQTTMDSALSPYLGNAPTVNYGDVVNTPLLWGEVRADTSVVHEPARGPVDSRARAESRPRLEDSSQARAAKKPPRGSSLESSPLVDPCSSRQETGCQETRAGSSLVQTWARAGSGRGTPGLEGLESAWLVHNTTPMIHPVPLRIGCRYRA